MSFYCIGLSGLFRSGYKAVIIAALVGASVVSFAQNARFSQISTNPIMLNPALSGRFNGDYKIGTLLSWQHTQTADMAHQTAFVDFKIGNNRRSAMEYHVIGNDSSMISKNNYFSAAISYYSYGTDVLGIMDNNSPLKASFVSGTLAYHFKLTQDNRHFGGVGLQLAYAKGTLNEKNGLYYDKEISGGGFKYEGNDVNYGGRKSENDYVDIQAGFYYGYKNELFRFELGGSVYHINHPSNDIFKQDNEKKLRMRGTLHSIFAFKVSDRFSLIQKNVFWTEGLYLRSRSTLDSANIVTLWGGVELHDMKPQHQLYMHYGLYTRSFRTIMPYISFNLKAGLNVRWSYEWALNGSAFPAYSADRAEVGISYSFFKKRSKGKNDSYLRYDLW
jgi:hypothetical protein